MNTAAKATLGSVAALAGAAALVLTSSNSKLPAPTAPTATTSTATPLTASSPMVGVPQQATALASAGTATPAVVTLARPDVFGFIYLGNPPAQTVPSGLSTAIAASAISVARWRGAAETFWASKTTAAGTQCWADPSDSVMEPGPGGKLERRGGRLVKCSLVVKAGVSWQPVAWK